MKVDVDSITDKGIVQEEDVNASSWDLDTDDVRFVNDIHLLCEFRRISDEILVKARVVSERQSRCSRCLEIKGDRRTQDFIFSYDRKTLGKFLEVDERIREEILLDWPMKPLCKDDCKGMCPVCGKNLNAAPCACTIQKPNPFHKLTADS